MNIEIPSGLIIYIATINLALFILGLIGFINVKQLIKEMKNRLAKILAEQSSLY